ncbi:MAG: dockerin type I repeat-containing protein [Coriobacteriales bacterium]|jgi:hypothetical protein|nr:dockerin type I repeat-containing protein [Coriobacteriales bacterium]
MLPATAFADAAQPTQAPAAAQPLSAPLVALSDEATPPQQQQPPAADEPAEPAADTVTVRLNYDLGSVFTTNFLRYGISNGKVLDYSLKVYRNKDLSGTLIDLVAEVDEQGLTVPTSPTARVPRTLGFDAEPGVYYFELQTTLASPVLGEPERRAVAPFTVVEGGASGLDLYLSGTRLSILATNGSSPNQGSFVTLTDHNQETVMPAYEELMDEANPAGGYKGVYYVVVATGASMPYHWVMQPADLEFSFIESNVFWSPDPALKDTWTRLNVKYNGVDNIVPSIGVKARFKVTAGAPISIPVKTGKHFTSYVMYPLVKQEAQEDGYDVWTGRVPNSFGVSAGGGGSGFVATVVGFALQPGLPANEEITFTLDIVRTEDVPYHYDNGWMEDSMLLNVNEAQHLVLAPGESFNLFPMRTWQAMAGVVTNGFFEPEYTVEVLGPDGTLSCTKAGSPGQVYWTLQGLQPGTNIVRLTYEPIRVGADGARDQSGLPGNHYAIRGDWAMPPDFSFLYFGATEPRDTGIVVVEVLEGAEAANSTNLKSNIDLLEIDYLSFDRDKTDRASYTFSPTADSGAVSVRTHRPVHEGTGVEWGSAWVSVPSNPDGSFTVDAFDGRNVVEVSAAGSDYKDYHVVNGRAVGVNVASSDPEWQPGDPFRVGDTAYVSFDGLKTPLPKLAGIYNPGYPGTIWVQYDTSDGRLVRSAGVQYVVHDVNTVAVPILQEGETVLSNGRIHYQWIGKSYGSHHFRVPFDGVIPSLDGMPFQEHNYSKPLPDVVLSTEAEPGPGAGASLSVTGPAEAVAGEPFDVAVSLAGAEQAATLVVSLELSEGVEIAEGPAAVTGLAGFEVMDVYRRLGTRTVDVTLAAWHPGATFDAATEVLRVALVAADPGAASVTLAGGELARYLDVTTTDVEVALPAGDNATVTVTVEPPPPGDQRFDVNRDGKETLADRAFAQLYDRASAETGGEPWAMVAERGMDVNADGLVDLADFVLILNYLYHR